MTRDEKKEKTWEVYIIQTESGQFYTGITNDFERRLREHQTKKKGASYFHLSKPARVVFRERSANRSEASRREAAIKKMTRAQKIELMKETKQDLDELA